MRVSFLEEDNKGLVFGAKLFNHAEFAGGKAFNVELQNCGSSIRAGIGIAS